MTATTKPQENTVGEVKLEIDLRKFIYECVPLNQWDAFLDEVSTEDRVIEHVTNQIVDGCTENGSWGHTSCAPKRFGDKGLSALDKAARRMWEAADETLREEIKDARAWAVRIAYVNAELERTTYLQDKRINHYLELIEAAGIRARDAAEESEETIRKLQWEVRALKGRLNDALDAKAEDVQP